MKLAAAQLQAKAVGVNPFSGGNGIGTYRDEGGEWYVEADYYNNEYVLKNKDTGYVKRVDSQTFDSIRFRYGYGINRPAMANMAPQVKVTLADRRDQRWRNKLLRMQQKKWDRRKARLDTAIWVAGWVWGGCLAFVVTVYLIKWVTHLVLG